MGLEALAVDLESVDAVDEEVRPLRELATPALPAVASADSLAAASERAVPLRPQAARIGGRT